MCLRPPLRLVALVRRLLRAALAVLARGHALLGHRDVDTLAAGLGLRTLGLGTRLLTSLGRDAAEGILVRTHLGLSARHLAHSELGRPTMTGGTLALLLCHLLKNVWTEGFVVAYARWQKKFRVMTGGGGMCEIPL